MLKCKAREIALFLSAVPLCAASMAYSSTVTQIVNPQTRPSADIHLSDLILQDGLGYECIEEAQIDVAFFAAGKGARLPQTCLPEPCREALSKVRLASLIGRAPTTTEWDDYYSRYAEICRNETTAFNQAGSEQPQDPSGFWIPILSASNPVLDAFIAGSGTGGGVTGSGSDSGPIIIGGGGGGGTSTSGPIIVAGGGGGGGTTPTNGGPEVSSGGTDPTDGDSSSTNGGGTDPNSGGGTDPNGGGGTDPNGGDGTDPNGGGGTDPNGGGGTDPNGGGGTDPNGGGGTDPSGGGGGDGPFGGGGDGEDITGGGGTGGETNLPVVPLPAGLWFMLSGVAAFGGLRLRKNRKS